MFFVGHISIAFILGYLIITKFQIRNISLSLLLFLSILPDIDILFRFVGVELAHRSITHSSIVFTIALLVFLLKYRKPSIIVYSIAYLSHVAIGDLVVGPLNLLYPFGAFYVTGGIDFKTSEHIFVEGLVLSIMTIIVIGRYYSGCKRNEIFPFEYSKKIDPIFYPLLIAAILVSPIFLLDETQKELTEFPNILILLIHSYDQLNTIAMLVLHLISAAIVIFLWTVTRRTYISNMATKKDINNIANTKL